MADPEWTFGTLLHHVETRIGDLKELLQQNSTAAKVAVDAALAAAKEAVAAALVSAEKAGAKAEQLTRERIDAHNQHQAATDKLVATFTTKEWAEANKATTLKEVAELRSRLAAFEERGRGMTMGVKFLMGLGSALLMGLAIYAALRK